METYILYHPPSHSVKFKSRANANKTAAAPDPLRKSANIKPKQATAKRMRLANRFESVIALAEK